MLPICPRHPGAVVRLYGSYGVAGHKRQRYPCVPIGAAVHTFTELLPRKRTAAGDCFGSERPYAQHEGPQTPRAYAFGVRDIGRALIRVGQGASYREAGRNVRRFADRRGANPPPYGAAADFSAEPNVVEDWVDVFASVVFAPFAPTHWPATVIADHMPFHIPAEVTRRSGTLAFCVFGAVGYDPMQPDGSSVSKRSGHRPALAGRPSSRRRRARRSGSSPTTRRGWSARSVPLGRTQATPRRPTGSASTTSRSRSWPSSTVVT